MTEIKSEMPPVSMESASPTIEDFSEKGSSGLVRLILNVLVPIGCILLTYYFAVHGNVTQSLVVVGFSCILIAFLLGRQMLNVAENERLSRRLTAAYKALETRAQQNELYATEATEIYAEMSDMRELLTQKSGALALAEESLANVREEMLRLKSSLSENAMLLKSMATRDGLTGLKNHAAFQEQLDLEWKRTERNKTPLSLVIIDIDHFRLYNETHGHPAGDEVLRNISQILVDQVRVTDYVARYGGEEFVVILPETGDIGAMIFAERCRTALLEANWPHGTVTSSFGIATSNTTLTSSTDLIALANQALQDSKDKGRDRICTATALAVEVS